ncbi:GGDEF domain-containing protein [Terriglobus roseus]|uniref:Diguanylate cyclase (GGDEF) domain-containing protein n=1 Tax=Terriglobus roseus TaxID=392734 RepID=A0A1H4LLD7_9BACT|nr:GGDEF domain-containing protein [Terriglobus roseus]SEB71550.1 diguanylate cyclase (GGDEF) domain-containing protein [Terriglobus roseus]
MNYLLLPDLFAMALLVSVLMFSGRRERDDMRLWTAGLLLILLECAARIVYTMRESLAVHRVSHVVALDAYLLAGVMFLLSASPGLRRMPRSRTFLIITIGPAMAMLAIYALDSRTVALYQALIGFGLLGGLLTCLLMRRRWTYYAVIAGLWVPLAIYSSGGHFRMAAYLSLALLYVMCAIAFARTLPSSSRGRIAVVAGFLIWSGCFLAHPWVSEVHPDWTDFLNELWNMQKFIITVGFLLVRLERQVISNQWLALHDELTRLPNRRLFDDRLQNALDRAARDGHRVAIFNLDLDGFKQINDTLGHDAGDVLLKTVGRNLENATRRTDTLARVGGDEFSLVAVDIGDDPMGPVPHPILLPQAERIFASMLEAVELPVPLGPAYGNNVARVSASVGVAFFPEDGTDATSLMRLADHRMYGQKKERARLRQTGEKAPLTLRTA